MNELFEEVKGEVAKLLLEKEFVKKGTKAFVKKEKLHKREEVITFSSVKGKAPHTDVSYISVTSGIYYKDVNVLDKKIIKDFLNSYPIISGSIGHYKNKNEGYFSVPINNKSQVTAVAKEIIENIELGGFNLFKKYSTLNKIIEGINNKDEWLNDYHKFLDFRGSIRVAAMYRLAFNKINAVEWFNNNAPDNAKKSKTLELIKEEW